MMSCRPKFIRVIYWMVGGVRTLRAPRTAHEHLRWRDSSVRIIIIAGGQNRLVADGTLACSYGFTSEWEVVRLYPSGCPLMGEYSSRRGRSPFVASSHHHVGEHLRDCIQTSVFAIRTEDCLV